MFTAPGNFLKLILPPHIFLLQSILVFVPSFVWGFDYDYETDHMAPIILVPGVVGAQVEGKWHTHGQPWYCEEKSFGWEQLWFRIRTGPGGMPLKCWVFRYKLIYNKTTHRSHNQIGVKTRVVGKFGSLKPVEYLTNDPISQLGSHYFDDIAKSFRRSGYSDEHNLKAAAYDGRYAMPQQEDFGYFVKFTELVERTAHCSKRRVSIVTHSMGGLVAAYFLVNKTQAWKNKYIHNFIAISTPWLGSPKAIEGFVTGTNFDVKTFKLSIMRELVRTFQSVALLLPAEDAYKETVLVDWPEQNKTYTGKDYKQLFTDMKYKDGYLMREDVRSLMPVHGKKLGVKLVCVWSHFVKTPFTMHVEGDMANPKHVWRTDVDGDGTVTLESLEYCKKFPNVTTRVFPGKDHLKIVFSDGVIDYIKSNLVHAKPVLY
ncbi:unnamed protein product [Bemisia tabaci]|uniref:Lecithin:cholesterol acyltransferase n=2 Tax=Bemisia tabaci TaxID=7038 RepID=A0A9P0A0T5_BEMTA|nr:unnamed protein product [Bemisia tabaci]